MAVKKKKKKTGSPGKKGQKRSASSAGKQVLQDGTKTDRFDLTMLPLLAGIVLIFAVPFFWIRAAGYALFICAAGWWVLKKSMREQAVLLFFFLLAYVISPYWLLSLPGMDMPPWMKVVFLIAAGCLWAAYHGHESPSGKVTMPDVKELAGWTGLWMVWGLIQANGLFVDIPWRGDEDSHFNHSSYVLVNSVDIFKKALESNTFYYFPLAALICLGVAFLLRWIYRTFYQQSSGASDVSALHCRMDSFLTFLVRYGWVIGPVVVWCFKGYDVFPHWRYRLLRYPFVAIWAAILPGWDIGQKVVIEPSWFRIASFSCFFAGSGIVFTWFWRNTRDWLSSFLLGCAILTLPLVLNYGSMYVLEPFIFPLSMLVFMYPEFFSVESPLQIRQSPQNTALCLTLLIKETAFPMLGVVGLMRAGTLLRGVFNGDTKLFDSIRKEIVYLSMLFLTVLPYLFFRLSSGLRSYHPNFSNLINLENYVEYAAGLWEQTGFVVILAVLGGILMVRQKRWAVFFPAVFLIGIYVVFFTMDGYGGYGRFNFLLLPGIIALFGFGLLSVWKQYQWKKWVVPVILCAVIGCNFYLSPLDVSSGVTRPLWERKTAENDTTYYPTKKFVSYLEKYYKDALVLLYVHDYRFVALEWAASSKGLKYTPGERKDVSIRDAYKKESEMLASLLTFAEGKKIPLVGYLCLNGPQPPALPANFTSAYHLKKLFKNPYRAIALYALGQK